MAPNPSLVLPQEKRGGESRMLLLLAVYFYLEKTAYELCPLPNSKMNLDLRDPKCQPSVFNEKSDTDT